MKDNGEPNIHLVEIAKSYMNAGWVVKIFTARVAAIGVTHTKEQMLSDIWEFCEKHFGKQLPITNAKDMRLVEFYDDRAVSVCSNFGIPVKMIDGRPHLV